MRSEEDTKMGDSVKFAWTKSGWSMLHSKCLDNLFCDKGIKDDIPLDKLQAWYKLRQNMRETYLPGMIPLANPSDVSIKALHLPCIFCGEAMIE